MQALWSIPAIVLYVIIAVVLIAGWLVMAREIRLDAMIEPDCQPRHQSAEISYPHLRYVSPGDETPVLVTSPRHDHWIDENLTADLADDADLAVARAHWTAAELGQWEVVNETWDFQRWEAEQDRQMAAARLAAAAVNEALDSGAWADPWWTRRYSAI